MRKNSLNSLLLLPALLLCAQAVTAGAPLKINFQGRLTESGQPAQGSKSFVFKIYSAASGGVPVWTGATQSVTLSEGVFSAELSAGTPALSTTTFAGARYVEMIVDGVVLSPRQEMMSAPYALVAQALAPDADVPPAAIEAGSLTDYHVALTTAAIGSGRFADDRVLITTGAFAALNGADQLVKLDAAGKLPALDGSALTGVAAASYSGNVAVSQLTGVITDSGLAISTGAFPGGFNGIDQLVKLDGSGNLPALNGSALTNIGAAQIPSLDAAKITTGKFNDARLAISTGAFPGGFNGIDQLVKLDGSGNLPALNGSALTNIGAAQIPSLDAAKITTGKFNDARLAISTGAFPGGFNGIDQLVKLDGSGNLPALNGSALTNVAAASYSGSVAVSQLAGVLNDNKVAISTGAFPGGFNAASKLVQLDSSGRLTTLNLAGPVHLPVKTVNLADMTLDLTPDPAVKFFALPAGYGTFFVNIPAGGDPDLLVWEMRLPSAAGAAGRVYTFKRIDNEGDTMSIVPAGAETIDGLASTSLSAFEAITLQSDGSNWYIINAP